MRLQRLKKLTYQLNGVGFYDEPRKTVNKERIQFLRQQNAQKITINNYWIFEFGYFSTEGN